MSGDRASVIEERDAEPGAVGALHDAKRPRTRRSLAVVAAVNDDEVLANNLMQSPMIQSEGIDVFAERGHDGAGKAYNAGLRRTGANYIIFAHQDVYFPLGWEQRLLSAIDRLEEKGEPWGILGVWGIRPNGQYAGRVWCTGSNTEYSVAVNDPVEVASVDEVVIVMNGAAGLRFDEQMRGFHLYATDIVLEAKRRGLKTFVFDGPVVHNSRSVYQLDRRFAQAYRYMGKKWSAELPLLTCTVVLNRSRWVLRKRWLKVAMLKLLGRLPAHARGEAPRKLAAQLGYE